MKKNENPNEVQGNRSAIEQLFYHLNSSFTISWKNRHKSRELTLIPQPVQVPNNSTKRNFFSPRIG